MCLTKKSFLHGRRGLYACRVCWAGLSTTFEGAGCAALQGFKGGLQQEALLGVHGLSLRLRDAEEGMVEQLHVIHEAAKALVGRKSLIPADVCLPPVSSPSHHRTYTL